MHVFTRCQSQWRRSFGVKVWFRIYSVDNRLFDNFFFSPVYFDICSSFCLSVPQIRTRLWLWLWPSASNPLPSLPQGPTPLSHGFNYHHSADLSNAFVVMVPPLISISRLLRFSGNFHLEFCHHFKLLMSKSKLLICALAKFICFSLYIFSSTFQSSKF